MLQQKILVPSILLFLIFISSCSLVVVEQVPSQEGPAASWSFLGPDQHTCPFVASPSDGFVVMLSSARIIGMCGALLQIDRSDYQQVSVRAIVVGICTFCRPDDINLSPTAFAQIASWKEAIIPGKRVPVEWYSP